MTIVLVLFVLTVVVFVTDRIPIEVWSLLVMVSLVFFGVLDPDEAFLGFAGSAV